MDYESSSLFWEEDTFPKCVHALCIASDAPILSASTWNDIELDSALATNPECQLEQYEFDVVKDLNRLFSVDIQGFLDETNRLVEESLSAHLQKPLEGDDANDGRNSAIISAISPKIDRLMNSYFPSCLKTDSLCRILKRLIISSLVKDGCPKAFCAQANASKEKNRLLVSSSEIWKDQFDRIDVMFGALVEKAKSGSDFEVLSNCFRMIVGLEARMNHGDFERRLADSILDSEYGVPPIVSRFWEDSNWQSVCSTKQQLTAPESSEQLGEGSQPNWDDIEPLSVYDAIPVYGCMWAVVLRLVSFDHTNRLSKLGSEVSFYFMHFFNSESSFRLFELAFHETGSPITKYEELISVVETFLKISKSTERLYSDNRYRRYVLELESALDAVKSFHRYFHLEVFGDEKSEMDGFNSVPYFCGYGVTDEVLCDIPLEVKIGILESYKKWAKFTSDVKIDTFPMLYACLLDTALRSGFVPKRCRYCGGMFFPEKPNQQYCHRVSGSTGIRCNDAELRRRTPGVKPHFNNTYQNIKKKASRAASKDFKVSNYYERLARFVHDSAGPLYKNSNKVAPSVYEKWFKETHGPNFGTVSELPVNRRPFPIIWFGNVVDGNRPLYVKRETEGFRFLARIREFRSPEASVHVLSNQVEAAYSVGEERIVWGSDHVVVPCYRFIELLFDSETKRIAKRGQIAKIPIPGLSECDDYTLGDSW